MATKYPRLNYFEGEGQTSSWYEYMLRDKTDCCVWKHFIAVSHIFQLTTL
jgi:hypothetical protein